METENQAVEHTARVKTGEHPFGDRGQVIGLIVFLAVFFLDSFVFKWTTLLARYVPFWARLGTWFVLFLLAVRLIRGGHGAVPHEAANGPLLIEDGAFAHVRHPLYLGTMLTYLGVFFITLSLAAFAVLLGLFAFYNVIAAYEERWLSDKYGQAYRDYMRKVPRWLPRLRAFTKN
jgi:protein-S-isoprenylcysteine O-methyltransferase Ste14